MLKFFFFELSCALQLIIINFCCLFVDTLKKKKIKKNYFNVHFTFSMNKKNISRIYNIEKISMFM